MCLIAWNWQPASPSPLLLISNRDEFFARPTAPLQWWDNAELLAGRDLQAGGTWLGISRSGRMAALTNYRDPAAMRSDAPSRGDLVSAFLQGDAQASDFLHALAVRASDCNPFNLLVFDGKRLMGLESRHARVFALAPGLGAVSNADFNTPWPKLARLKAGLQHLLEQVSTDDAQLLHLLQDRRIAPDHQLPATGLPLPLERALSAAFIALPDYGTRACSVLRFAPDGISFVQQSFAADGSSETRRFWADAPPN